MSLVEYDLINGKVDKVEKAIKFLQDMATLDQERGLYVAYSGGKDSDTILELCKMAGVKFDAHYRVTSVDPPELVQYIKQFHPEVSIDIPHDNKGKPVTMWNLIPRKMCMPTRIRRYCCTELKETGGAGRLTVTGVRWAESARRKNSRDLIDISDKGERLYRLNYDNAEATDIIDSCFRTKKTTLNPIIAWSDEDVWEFIKERAKIPYCKLYDEGIQRIGCIGCPMSTVRKRAWDMQRWPQYRKLYVKAISKLQEDRRTRQGRTDKWAMMSDEDYFDWWITGEGEGKEKELEGQITFEEWAEDLITEREY